jgi:periplasmic copper chaperone A
MAPGVTARTIRSKFIISECLMSLLKTTVALIFLALAATSVYAYNTVSILRPWALATKPGQTTGAVYMELETSESAIIAKIESPQAKAVEVHNTINDKGVMKMRKIDRLELPAGTTIKFEPGGMHLMLIGLKKPLKPGDSVLVKFTLLGSAKKESSLQVDAAVRDAPPAQAKSAR